LEHSRQLEQFTIRQRKRRISSNPVQQKAPNPSFKSNFRQTEVAALIRNVRNFPQSVWQTQLGSEIVCTFGLTSTA
jgi:hypothetical protein